jgi:5-oxoprolinase (ATP-hydrolysing)
MSFAIKYQLQKYGSSLKSGDVLLANSPIAGGSHLPDLTVITPVFDANDSSTIIFFTASRGHHADIGGITGGSMPATSTSLIQEGAEIVSFKLVEKGKFDGKGLYRLLVEEPAKYPGCSGCRDYKSVESDIKAVSADVPIAFVVHR